MTNSYIYNFTNNPPIFLKMSHNTPDSLLKLAADLNKLGGELCAIGGKLAQAATTLEQEAANVALTNAQRWGVDVQVCGSLARTISVSGIKYNMVL